MSGAVSRVRRRQGAAVAVLCLGGLVAACGACGFIPKAELSGAGVAALLR